MVLRSAILIFTVSAELFACKSKQEKLSSESLAEIVKGIAKTNVLMSDAVGAGAYGFAAVRNFPDASFFPILQQALKNEVAKDNNNNNERLRLLYQAIVQYKDQPSRGLLKSALDEAKGMQSIYHADYLHQALKLYPSTVYDGLLKPVFSGTSH